jgi:hypothetical protein
MLELLDDEWLSEAEMAEAVGKCLRTIRTWRKVGMGPPYSRFGRTVKYRKMVVAEHFRATEITPVRERYYSHRKTRPPQRRA